MIPRFSPQHAFLDILLSILPKKHALEDFEKDFAKIAQSKYAVAFPYGRTGLWAILEALQIKNKEIICPAYTCVVVAHTIISSNNKPVFIDSKTDDFNMNLELLDSLITPNTAAIIATSIFGHPLKINELQKLKTKYPNIHVIQDCAHSFFCSDQDIPIQKQGIASFYGMNISKIIHGMFLGAVATDDPDLYSKLKSIVATKIHSANFSKSVSRSVYALATWLAFKPIIYSFVLWIKNLGLIDRFTKYYDENRIDMPIDYLEQSSNFDFKIATRILKRYDHIIAIRRACAKIYFDSLKNIKEIELPPNLEGATYSHFVIRIKKQSDLKDYLLKHGIEPGELIEYVIPKMPAYSDSSSYPVSEKFVNHTLNLNVMNLESAKKTVSAIKAFYGVSV